MMAGTPLLGQVALVTGAGDELGIGFASARMVASHGARVFLTSTTDRCHARAQTLLQDGFDVLAMPADLTTVEDLARLLVRVRAEFGAISLLVNNAGMTSVNDPMREPQLLHEMDFQQWTHTVDRNLGLTFAVTAAVLPDMLALGHGRTVNVASTTGVTGAMMGEAAYAAAKAGIVGLTRATALEYAKHGITANAVAPGWIATGSQTTDERRQGLASPIGRSGTPDEVAHLVAALCAPQAAYITGQCIVIHGGNAIAEERALR